MILNRENAVIELKDQTSPGLMLLSTQFQNGNEDCVLSNPIYYLLN